ncbi:helix-turn-helix transcriptional regulator [Bdellovibrio sp. HCB290]|uniref:helix-turn-helix transcriptional regulator n=1 Tax=Bdellovibrio sp. HCB290 TaxID=3394356 RepID=UPI0039B427DC
MRTKNLGKLLEKGAPPLSFGGFLRSARTNKDLSQTDMAQFLKISKSTLCDIEKGRQHVSIELAVKIAKKCGLSEALAAECSIRDSFRKAGLKMSIEVKLIA